MPTYTFRDKVTGEEYDKIMSYTTLDEYLESNLNVRQVIGVPKMIASAGTEGIKVDDGFREAMAKVKETYTINNIKDY